jgi:hypothetical protein
METTPETRDLDVAALVRDYASKARARYKEVGSPYMHGARDWLASLESMLDRRAIPAPPASAPAAEGREDHTDCAAMYREVWDVIEKAARLVGIEPRRYTGNGDVLCEALLAKLAPPPPAERAAEDYTEELRAQLEEACSAMVEAGYYPDDFGDGPNLAECIRRLHRARPPAAPERAQPAAQGAREKAEAIVQEWYRLPGGAAYSADRQVARDKLTDAIAAALADRQAGDAELVRRIEEVAPKEWSPSTSRLPLVAWELLRNLRVRLTDGAAAEGKP